MAYKYFSSGYLVKDGKVLLLHHKKFDKWTPPGGHLEEDETPDRAVIREWKEELSLDIEIIPATQSAFAGDSNAMPIPMPFYIDLEREGFDVPHVGFFFYVLVQGDVNNIHIQKSELHSVQWFAKEDLPSLETFDQVRALASYAIENYPKHL